MKDSARLEKELPTLGVPYDMKIYPQAGHGFMNRRTNPVVDFIGRATGAVAYQPEAAADATQRLLAFLQQHL